MKWMSAIAATGLATALTAGALASDPPAKIALTGARIIPVVGEEIPNGTIVIEHGIITAIGGADIEIPFDATEFDLTGKVLMPGMIDPHSASGLDVSNENLPVGPFLDVYDAIDPSRLFFEESLRDGVTTIHVIQANNTVIGAVSRVVRPIGLSVDEMTVMPDIALKLSTSPRSGFDRMMQMATLREAFDRHEHYVSRLAERKYEEQLRSQNRTINVGPAEARERGRSLVSLNEYDDQNRNLGRLLRGDLGAWIYAGTGLDVAAAIGLAQDLGILESSVFVLGSESHNAINELRETGRPVVLHPSLYQQRRDRRTGELVRVFIPKLFHDAGIPFALQTNPSASLAERYLTYQAAICVREGLSREVALRSITLSPAEMLGMGDELGSLEVGKRGNVVVMSGDPLDFSSWVEHVFIDGVHAYDRDRDFRLQELLRQMNAGDGE